MLTFIIFALLVNCFEKIKSMTRFLIKFSSVLFENRVHQQFIQLRDNFYKFISDESKLSYAINSKIFHFLCEVT